MHLICINPMEQTGWIVPWGALEVCGLHRVHWNGRDDRGRSLASGVYLYRMVTNENVQTRKLTLLR